jgi:hypothetical protein
MSAVRRLASTGAGDGRGLDDTLVYGGVERGTDHRLGIELRMLSA